VEIKEKEIIMLKIQNNITGKKEELTPEEFVKKYGW